MTRIAVVGSGVVGGATGRGFAKVANADVTFVDVNELKLESLREEGFDAIQPDDMDLSQIDLVFISVPTPTMDGVFVKNYLESACSSVGQALGRCDNDRYPVVVFRSTMLAGTTETHLIPLLEEASGKVAGIDFGVSYNPEYLREYNADDDFASLDVVTIGHDPKDSRSAEIITEAYAPFDAEVFYLGIKEAEWHKYAHNVSNAIKISAFNEMRIWGEAEGLTPDRIQVIFNITAKTAESLYNPMYGLRDKGAYGGACLPKEVNATVYDAEVRSIHLPIIKATQEINRLLDGE